MPISAPSSGRGAPSAAPPVTAVARPGLAGALALRSLCHPVVLGLVRRASGWRIAAVRSGAGRGGGRRRRDGRGGRRRGWSGRRGALLLGVVGGALGER